MSEDEKIVRLDVTRIEYGKSKLCQCEAATYIIDKNNYLVTCAKCGAIVEPFDALLRIAKDHERINRQMDAIREEKAELESYQPRLRVIKELERRYSGTVNSSVPSCPHCGEHFDLKELIGTSWQSRSYYEKRRNQETNEQTHDHRELDS